MLPLYKLHDLFHLAYDHSVSGSDLIEQEVSVNIICVRQCFEVVLYSKYSPAYS